MNCKGIILKMRTEYDNPVRYFLKIGENELLLNDLLNQHISLKYSGKINCIKCGRETSKSFSQGFCFPCFKTAPETEECVLRPELCKAHEGIARDLKFAENHCLVDHYVYLSLTSGIKVGVTRHTQIPTRWIDQGAVKALKIARTPNRYLAGLIEVDLKNYLADKTNWRNMLTSKISETRSLLDVKAEIQQKLNNKYSKYLIDDNNITDIVYPLLGIPEKVKALNFDKTPDISGLLTGIKGQYLIFNNSEVLNIRKFGGYNIEFSN